MKAIKTKKKRHIPLVAIIIWTGAISFLVFILAGDRSDHTELPVESGQIIGGSIAYDGTHYWGMRITVAFGNDVVRELVQFTQSGEFVKVFNPRRDFRGVTFDGEYLWTADARGSDEYFQEYGKFYTIDRETGTFTERFTLSKNYLIDGIAASEYRLWILGRYTDNRKRIMIWEVDMYSESVVNETEVSDIEDMVCSGITYHSDHLWALMGMTDKVVYEVNPRNGSIIEKFDFTERLLYGITTDGKEVLVADGVDNKLYPLDYNPE